ncbi:hypothetical protein ACFQRB_19375 [Halobaculum litoreum]|uniref:Uncharacterized protein n=1 Tax=Halobaculum litoreum TaxID=3031998 RepID=A0ABD5XSI9_9EURY
MTHPTATTPRSVAQAFLTAPVRPQTYKNLAYLALQFPLGVAYFVLLVPALAFGLGTLPCSCCSACRPSARCCSASRR